MKMSQAITDLKQRIDKYREEHGRDGIYDDLVTQYQHQVKIYLETHSEQVFFNPCRHASEMTYANIVKIGGLWQLEALTSGTMCGVITFETKDCPTCAADREQAKSAYALTSPC